MIKPMGSEQEQKAALHDFTTICLSYSLFVQSQQDTHSPQFTDFDSLETHATHLNDLVNRFRKDHNTYVREYDDELCRIQIGISEYFKPPGYDAFLSSLGEDTDD